MSTNTYRVLSFLLLILFLVVSVLIISISEITKNYVFSLIAIVILHAFLIYSFHKSLSNRKLDLFVNSPEIDMLISNSKVGIWKYDFNSKDLIISSNIHRILQNDVITDYKDLVKNHLYGDEIERIKDMINKSIERKLPERGVYRAVLTNGKEKSIKISCSPLFRKNKLIAAYGFFEDVTEQFTEIKSLELKYELLLKSINNSSDGFVLCDLNGKILYWNKAEEELTGFNAEEVLGEYIWTVQSKMRNHEIDDDFVKIAFQNVLQNGVSSLMSETKIEEFRSKDGRSVYIEVSYFSFPGHNGYYIGAFSKDVTDRIIKETKNKFSKKKYFTIINNIKDCIFIHGVNDDGSVGNFIEVNDEAIHKYDFTRDEFLTMSPMELDAPEEKNNVNKHAKRVIDENTVEFETIHMSKSGQKYNVLIKSSFFEISGTRYIVSIVHDITDLIKKQEEFLKAKTLLEKMTELIPSYIFIYNLIEKKKVYSNKNFADMLGYSKEEIDAMGTDVFSQLAHKDSLSKLPELFAQLETMEDNDIVEINLKCKDSQGEYKWLNIKDIVYSRTKEGKVKEILGIIEDVDKQVRTLNALERSEKKFSQLAKSSPVGIVRSNAKGENTYVNPCFVQIAELDKYIEILDKKWINFIHPEDKEYVLEEVAKCVGKNYSNIELVFRLITKKNNLKWVEFKGVAEFDENNQYIGYISSMNDITELINKNSQLEFRNRALEQAYDGFAIVDSDYILKYINPAWCKLLQLKHEEIINKSIFDFHKTPKERIIDVAENLQKNSPFSFEMNHVDNNNIEHPFHVSIFLLYNENEDSIGYVVVAKDISEARRIEKERKDIERRLFQAQKLDTIGNLAGGIAHDFNNLLTPIIGYAQMSMMDIEPDTELHNNCKLIFNNASIAKELIEQILTFSRKQEHKTEQVRISESLKETVEFLQSIASSQIEINTEIEDNLPIIMADSIQMKQVFLNLGTNAIKALAKKEDGLLILRAKAIKIDKNTAQFHPVLAQNDYIKIEIEDNGIGMNEITKQRVFEPFYTTRGPGEGTGLGLSVAHGIINNHNGFIEVESEENVGTKFIVYLPTAENYENAFAESLDDKIFSIENQLSQSSIFDEKILLIDDDVDVGNITLKMLKKLGYSADYFQCHQMAFEHFRKNSQKYSLIICDQKMPKKSGVQVIKQIHHINPDLPAIIVTGYSETLINRNPEELGISAVIFKPVDLVKLGQTIAQTIEKKDNPEDYPS